MPEFVPDPARWSPRIRWSIASSLFLGVLLAGLFPNPMAGVDDGALGGMPYDKIAHFAVYAVWAFLFFSDPKSTALWMLPLFLLAFLQESSQLLVAGREFEWLDWISDSLGILVAFFGARFRRCREQNKGLV